MVPPTSHGIPRAPRYSGYCQLRFDAVYVTLTLFGGLSHALRLPNLMRYAVHNPKRISTFGLAFSDFAHHYSRNLV